MCVMLDRDVVTNTERRVLHVQNKAKNLNGGLTGILEQKHINSNLNTLILFIRPCNHPHNEKTLENEPATTKSFSLTKPFFHIETLQSCALSIW